MKNWPWKRGTGVRPSVLPGLAAALVLWGATGSAELVDNGGAETLDAKGMPAGWYRRGDEPCNVETGMARTGRNSLRIHIDDTTELPPPIGKTAWTRYAFWCRYVDVTPETTYTLRSWVRTRMSSGVVGCAFRFRQGGNWLRGHWTPTSFFPVRGSQEDWVQMVYTFQTPAQCNRVDVMLVAEDLTGTAWFDDVSLVKGLAVPVIPTANVAPTVDGATAPDEWEGALTLNGFLSFGQASLDRVPAEVETEIRLLTNHTHLFVRAACAEPEMARNKSDATQRDGAVWADDSIELFIDAQRDQSSYYQIAVNSRGAVYDACGRDAGWSPAELRAAAWQSDREWGFELVIPVVALGYGPQEVTLPEKAMALAAFRNRHWPDRHKITWLTWPQGNYAQPTRFFPVDVGVEGKGETVSFRYRGYDETALRPPQAWVLEDPLFEELMGDAPLFAADDPVAFMDVGRQTAGGAKAIAFALQHGMRHHEDDLLRLYQDLRLLLPGGPYHAGGIDPKRESPHYRRQKRYQLPLSVCAMMKCGGRQYAYSRRPQAPTPKYDYLFLDERVRDSFLGFVTDLVRNHSDQIHTLILGHEDHNVPMRHYNTFRELYLEQDPDTWAKWDDEVRREYGFGKYGLPESKESATPFERIALQYWSIERFNKHARQAADAARRESATVDIVSDIAVAGLYPMGYERARGTYGYITQQMTNGSGPYRQSCAFATKMAGDLAGVPVRAGCHIEHYLGSLSGAEANEVLSSVFRVGGRSLALWLIDWFGKTGSDMHGAPERYRQILHVLRQLPEMRQLRFPKPDGAILYSNISHYGEHWWGGAGLDHEVAFTLLGPRARSWFQFVSDFQIADRTVNLGRFKVLYVPRCVYQDDETVDRIRGFVGPGGTLVAATPHVFRWRPDGTERKTLPVDLAGVHATGKRPTPGAFRIVAGNDMPALSAMAATPIPVFADEVLSIELAGARSLAEFADGQPAVMVNKVGQGRVVTFAVNPFRHNALSNRTWWQFFKALQQDLGCGVDRDIWRFRFPLQAETPESPYPEDLLCLTGNACGWRRDRPALGPNAARPFTCTYSDVPDLIAEEHPGRTRWDRRTGDLFDRPESLRADPLRGRKPLTEELAPWVVGWQQTDAVTVRLEFEAPVTASEARLWLHGQIPGTTVGVVSGPDKAFTSLATLNAWGHSGEDVRELRLGFAPAKAKVFEIRFGARPRGPFIISEMELWGTPVD